MTSTSAIATPAANDSDSIQTNDCVGRRRRTRARRGRGRAGTTIAAAGLMLFAATAAAADCISLATSTACPAFKEAKISTSDALKDQFPFLAYVTDTSTFDTRFNDWINTEYVSSQYQNRFGCSNVSLQDTSDKYARFTRTVMCSRMVQGSATQCGLSAKARTPICAETCATFARSEQIIVSNDDICPNVNQDIYAMIRSDFAICSEPTDALDRSCISGVENEKDNCGFSNNLPGLCLYCSQSSVDSTDTCCYNAKAESRCVGIKLPKITDLPPLLINSTTNATANPSPDSSSKGLSGGAIAGITIGTLLGVGLLAGLFLLLLRRRRQSSPQSPTFNQPRPSHSRSQPSMSFTAVAGPGSYHGRGYEVLGGGRVARMSALERGDGEPSSPGPVVISHRNAHNSSSSDFSRDPYRSTARPLGPPPRTRNASLSSTSIMMESSPSTGRGIQTNPSLASGSQGFPSPGGMTTQSEQLAFFKDYYSPGDIHPGDKVSTLWAYAPRAPDEFELERGEMLKVVGIWDDGWATGIRLEERAEDFGVAGHDSMRDSGVSGGKDSGIAASAAGRDGLGSRGKDRRDEMDGVVKAFPLVCVCLPEVWGKMVESGGHEGSERAWEEYRGSGSSGEEAETEGVSGKKVTEKFSRSGGIGSP